ncbi:MAG: type III secretion system chaperone [Gammaproteobacteria bacterium]|nr:type III secretion system chaperone [Gammaproteobacteria bacterium]
MDLAESVLKYAGIDPEGFEETNKALVSLDRETTILIAVENRLIHLIGFLGAVVETDEFPMALLRENFKSVAQARYRYSIEPESGELLMSYTLQCDGLDETKLIDSFTHMADYVKKWSRSLAAGSATVPEPDDPADRERAPGESPDEDLASRPASGFIRA